MRWACAGRSGASSEGLLLLKGTGAVVRVWASAPGTYEREPFRLRLARRAVVWHRVAHTIHRTRNDAYLPQVQVRTS